MKTFLDWVKIKESSAFTRKRDAAFKGLGPSISCGEINSHDTAKPWVRDAIMKRNKKCD